MNVISIWKRIHTLYVLRETGVGSEKGIYGDKYVTKEFTSNARANLRSSYPMRPADPEGRTNASSLNKVLTFVRRKFVNSYTLLPFFLSALSPPPSPPSPSPTFPRPLPPSPPSLSNCPYRVWTYRQPSDNMAFDLFGVSDNTVRNCDNPRITW